MSLKFRLLSFLSLNTLSRKQNVGILFTWATCSIRASFWRQFLYSTRKMAPETPFTPASFLAQETCQSERGFRETVCGRRSNVHTIIHLII